MERIPDDFGLFPRDGSVFPALDNVSPEPKKVKQPSSNIVENGASILTIYDGQIIPGL
jgi:hypothetical protein